MDKADAPALRKVDCLRRFLREMPSEFCMTRRYHKGALGGPCLTSDFVLSALRALTSGDLRRLVSGRQPV
jgi:hypothetical protein